ncbi:MAG TPA: ABC transporter ATP-binding protein [Polyangiaceae bacterium]|nr:ABC transporter ATP-binding protein [Polyangiaceae bacterium]
MTPPSPTNGNASPLGDAPRGARNTRAAAAVKAFHEEERFGKAYDLRLVKKSWPFIRPHQKLLWLSLGVVFFTAGSALVRPLIMRHALDEGVVAGHADQLMRGGLMLASVMVVEQVLGFMQMYAMQVAGARAMSDLRRHVFDFLHRQRLGFFDRQLVGKLVSRVTNDVDSMLELFASGALLSIGDLIKLVGIIVLMIMLDPHMALFAFVGVPPVAFLVMFVRRRMRDAFRAIRGNTARMNATTNEQVSGMTVIQAFGRPAAAAREFDEVNAGYRDANNAAIKWDSIQDAAIDTIGAVCLASVIAYTGHHPVSFGLLVAFSAYIKEFFEPISALAQRYTLLQSAMAGAERVFSLLDAPDPDCPATDRGNDGDTSLDVELEHVDFEYKPGVPVLRDLSFRVPRGEKVALVGPTGSGKTTITALLLRLYEISGGSVRVQGKDVRKYDRESLRRLFAVVPQDVYLFPGSVMSNIAAGVTPDRARVEDVLRRLGAYEVFASREQGLDTPVQEQGKNFSTGERQLIAFARAMYRDAPILILDEATASIDSDTESRLSRALTELMRGRTALIIAHRLSTVRAADRILVLQRGRLVEQGNHEELIAHGGLYARLHELQFSRTDPASSRELAASEALPAE